MQLTLHKAAPIRIAELFAGIGGVTGGFIDAGGFDPVFLADVDPKARAAFAANFPTLKDRYYSSRVEQLTGPMIREASRSSIDGLLGCPPCQGLSSVGPRNPADPRNDLLQDMHRLIWSITPRFFLMENVPALLSSPRYRCFQESLSRRYRLCAAIVNAAEYGLPQLRRRAVVLGLHRSLGVEPSLPAPTHGGRGRVFDYNLGRYVKPALDGRSTLKLRASISLPNRALTTLRTALGDLQAQLGPGESCDSYGHRPTTSYQREMRRGARQLTDHIAWRHGQAIVERLRRTEPGQCPAEFGRWNRNTRYFSQAYSRLHEDGLARTITTNFHNPGSGRFTHWACPRTLTVREALRVQGFPDMFSLQVEGLSRGDAERLVGNAFPRPLARILALHVAALLPASAPQQRRTRR